MRIIAGSLRGRRIGPVPRGVRPTADRVREAIFSRLGSLEGASVLDLFAGSGALGIESISRGARRVVFVERTARTASALRDVLQELGVGERARVVRSDAVAALRRLGAGDESFDLVFVDPPYAGEEAARALDALRSAGVLASGAEVVLEGSKRNPLEPPEGWVCLDERVYGDTSVTSWQVEEDAAKRDG